MKKIVFLDIDGTILDSEKKIRESTKLGVKKLQDSGVHVVIATGRVPNEILEIRKELNIDCYVCCNGSYAVHDNEVVFDMPIPSDQLEKLYEYSTKCGHALAFLSSDDCSITFVNEFVERSLGTIFMPIPTVNPNFYKENKIYQVLVFCDDNLEDTYKKEVGGLDYIRWHEYSVDVLPKNGSKAVGIKKMIEKLGYKLENTYAFGDGENDIEMLSEVGIGVAMGNASDHVKSFADFVTTHVDDDGIYNGLKELELI